MNSPNEHVIRSKVFNKIIEARVRMIEYKFMGERSVITKQEISRFRKVIEDFERQLRLN